jgi:hypothetical protein
MGRFLAAQAAAGPGPDGAAQQGQPQQLCALDHEHCHFCLQKGHPAFACAEFLAAAGDDNKPTGTYVVY